MKLHHLILFSIALLAAFLLGTYNPKEEFAVNQEPIPGPHLDLQPILDSVIEAQAKSAKHVELMRGVLIGNQKNNVLLGAELLKLSDKLERFTLERKDTARYAPNISIRLPDSLFKQSAPVHIQDSKTYALEIKDSTIALLATINKDSLTLNRVEIPNSLVVQDEVIDINAEKQIRTTTITNSNPLLNTKPIVVINQTTSEKGITKKKRKAFLKGAVFSAVSTIIICLLL